MGLIQHYLRERFYGISSYVSYVWFYVCPIQLSIKITTTTTIPPIPRVPRIPFPVPVFLFLYIALFLLMIFSFRSACLITTALKVSEKLSYIFFSL